MSHDHSHKRNLKVAKHLLMLSFKSKIIELGIKAEVNKAVKSEPVSKSSENQNVHGPLLQYWILNN